MLGCVELLIYPAKQEGAERSEAQSTCVRNSVLLDLFVCKAFLQETFWASINCFIGNNEVNCSA